MAQQVAAQGAGQPQSQTIPDMVLMYACIFNYEKQRIMTNILQYNSRVQFDSIEHYETSNQIQQGSSQVIRQFVSLDNEAQRDFFDNANKENCEKLFRTLFQIVQKVNGEPELVKWTLALINGILEDNRQRIVYIKGLQASYNQQRKVDCIRILNSFLTVNSETAQRPERDMAAHTLAQIISYMGIDKCKDDAHSFMMFLISAKDNPETMSQHTYTHCLMHLLRINGLAEVFIQSRGFQILHKLLLSSCQTDSQIAYNVCTCFWILSYHSFALPYFQDFKLNTIEHIAKILDFSNKEKSVRMICNIFLNLKNDEICLEHLSMINALNLVVKLSNRPWVDESIKQTLEELFEFFDKNYQEFSSFEKWKAQVSRRQLCWSPVHTEKFWQTSFIYFNNEENLQCIDILVEILKQKVSPDNDQASLDTMKAVACYDLGEFARFFPLGKEILEERDTKAQLAELMGDQSSSAELKKEAITAYQKMLMHSWGQSQN